MAFTPEQEAILAEVADAIRAQKAYDAKKAELQAARIAAEAKLPPLRKGEEKVRIAEVGADPEVAKLLAEAEALKAAL